MFCHQFFNANRSRQVLYCKWTVGSCWSGCFSCRFRSDQKATGRQPVGRWVETRLSCKGRNTKKDAWRRPGVKDCVTDHCQIRGVTPERRLYMSSETKEFIVSTEYPGYVFLGWAMGKFETKDGQRQPYYNMYVLSPVNTKSLFNIF